MNAPAESHHAPPAPRIFAVILLVVGLGILLWGWIGLYGEKTETIEGQSVQCDGPIGDTDHTGSLSGDSELFARVDQVCARYRDDRLARSVEGAIIGGTLVAGAVALGAGRPRRPANAPG